MAVIGVIADDFTGTASAGVLLARTGVRTGLFFDIQAVKDFADARKMDAVYVSSNSRHYEPEQAYEEVARVMKEFKKMGIMYFSKKIDTTLRGGIGYEIDAMLDTIGRDVTAVVVTAMPQSKRICVGGYSVIDSVMLSETAIADDVKTSVYEDYVPDLLKSQSKYPVELLGIKDVMRGPDHIKEKLEILINDNKKIIVIDAVSIKHVDDIARACTNMEKEVLAVDPGPFTMKLSYYRGVTGTRSENTRLNRGRASDRPILIVAGSANPQTKKQFDYLCSHMSECKKISVSPNKLISDNASDEIMRVSEQVIHLIKSGEKRVIIVETGVHGEVIDLQKEDVSRKFRPGTSSLKINDGLAEITNIVLACVGQEQIGGLALTGGDTMECVCRKIGVQCIEALDNIVAQVDVGRIIGKYNGLPVVAKGGFCGEEDVGIKIVERLSDR